MKPAQEPLSRRRALALLGAAPLVLGLPAGAEAPPEVIVHRDPSCGCCGAWVEHLKRAGFPVKVAESRDLDAVKQRLGVPADLISCHTAEVAGYVVEGHVPAVAIQRLLAQSRRRPDSPCRACRSAHREWRANRPTPTMSCCSARKGGAPSLATGALGRSDACATS